MNSFSSTVSPEQLWICQFADTMVKIRADGLVYHILNPLYFVLTFGARLLSLVAFYFQAKTESTYLYQIFLTLAECFDAIVFTLASFSWHMLSGLEVGRLGHLWFKQCYICMFYDSHLAMPLQMGSILWCLILSVSMTIDRIFALGSPIEYSKKKKRALEQWITFLITFLLAFSFTFLISFHIMVEYDPEKQFYTSRSNPDWTPITLSFIQVHTSIKASCTFALIILNVIFLSLLHKEKTLYDCRQQKSKNLGCGIEKKLKRSFC